jgi:ATP-dependent Lon protease
MIEPGDVTFDDRDFAGQVRLFPLPNLVLFPHVIQPLHVFEPRYRALVDEALATDKLITMALLRSGWERDYEGRPPVASTACLGKVITFHRLDDGRYNLLLVGLRRIELLEELPACKAFREALARIKSDRYSEEGKSRRSNLRDLLLTRFQEALPQWAEVVEPLKNLGSGLTLGMLTDLVAYSINLDIRLKVKLLAETDVDRRALVLIERLADVKEDVPTEASPAAKRFPPDFSLN